jgi:hypothetical protein
VDVRDQLKELLLARWEVESEKRLLDAQLKHLDAEIKALGDKLDAEDTDEDDDPTLRDAPHAQSYATDDEVCGKPLKTGDYCARPAGHDLTGSIEGRRHRGRAALDRKNDRKRDRRAARWEVES